MVRNMKRRRAAAPQGPEAVRGGLGGRGAPERPRGPGAGSARGSAPINSLEATVFFFLPQSLCSLRRWLWVWDRRQWPPRPFGRHFSPHLCVLFEILPATNHVRVLSVVCAVRQFACCWLPLRFAPLAAGCFLCHRTLDGLGQDVCGHGGGVFARLPWTVFGGWRAPRGTGECGLLGNCGWIGCFSQPQCHSRYSSPFPNPLGHVSPPSSRTSL